MGTHTTVDQLPACQMPGCEKLAAYDARTIHGWWAFLCGKHFVNLGVGLGTGTGQKLVQR